VINVDNPDLEKYPLFEKATVYEVILEPGDILFIPSLWFHNVRAETPCISINLFFHHLPEASYPKRDLYGNVDPLVAQDALEKIKEASELIRSLPPYYHQFYEAKMIAKLKEDMRQ